MTNLTERVGQFLRDRIFSGCEEDGEDDISEYLYQREEIALQSLQKSLRALKKYQFDAGKP
jgi:hypothetical protein